MQILLNDFLFFWAFAFSFHTPVYNQTATMQIDLQQQRVYLRFDGLYYEKGSEKDRLSYDNWQQYFKTMENRLAERHSFRSYTVDLKRCKGKTLLCIQGGFEDKQAFMEALYFRQVTSEKGSRGWRYVPFSQERLMDSNAQEEEGGGLFWAESKRYIELKLERNPGLNDGDWEEPVLRPLPLPKKRAAR